MIIWALGITLHAKGPNPRLVSVSERCSCYRRNACCKTSDDCVYDYFRQMHFAKLLLGTRRNAFSSRTHKSGCCITFLTTYSL